MALLPPVPIVLIYLSGFQLRQPSPKLSHQTQLHPEEGSALCSSVLFYASLFLRYDSVITFSNLELCQNIEANQTDVEFLQLLVNF